MRSIGISEIAWRGLVLALLCMATAAPSWAQINFPRTVRVDSTSIDPVQGSVATASIRFDPGNVGPTYQVRTRLIVPGFIVDVAAQPISASTTCTAQLIVSPTSRVWHVDVVAVKSRCSEIFCLVPSPYGNERLCDVTFTGTQFITPGQFSLDLAADQTSCDDQWVTVARSAAKTPVFCSTSDGALTARGASFGSSPSIGTPIVFDNVTTSTPRLRQLNLTNSGTYQAAVQLSGLKAPLSASPVSLVVPANDDFVVDIACAAPVPVVVAGVVTDIDQVLTATISHDPNRSQANYPVKCKRIAPPIGLDPFASTPTANGASRAVAMDASGSSLVFESVATNLLASADADGADIFLFDAPTGNIQMASLDNEEASVTTAVMEPSLSAQGDLVAFVTADAGVKRLLGESEKQSERRRKAGGFSVYLRDRISGTTQRVGGAMPGGVGTTPRLAPDGLSLVLVSPATSTEGVPDQANVYRVKLPRVGGIPQPDAPDCLSCKVDDGNGRKGSLNANGVSNSPVVSASGEWVAWETTATNTVLGQAPLCGNTQVILRNAISGATQRISAPTSATQCASGGSRKPSIDYAGRKLVFESDLPLGRWRQRCAWNACLLRRPDEPGSHSRPGEHDGAGSAGQRLGGSCRDFGRRRDGGLRFDSEQSRCLRSHRRKRQEASPCRALGRWEGPGRDASFACRR
jgi:hypothetical protein